MSIKTTNAAAPFAQKYYDRVLLDRAMPYLAHDLFGQQKPLKTKSGTTISFRRFEAFSAATTALTEGQTPAISDYTVTEVTATVSQYGYVVGVTDMVDATKPDAHLTELTQMLGEQMGLTKDTIIRDAVVGSTSTLYCSTAASTLTLFSAAHTEADTVLDEDMLKEAYRLLRVNDAKHFTEIIRPGTGYASTPLGPAYWAIVHPTMAKVIKGFTDWNPVQNYASTSNVLPGEIGECVGIRFVESTNAKTVADAGSGGASTGYYIPVFAPNAYGVVPLDTQSGSTYFQDFGSGDDILEQRAKVGWKGAWTATVLNDAFMLTILTLPASA